jgi:hypothetical protein
MTLSTVSRTNNVARLCLTMPADGVHGTAESCRGCALEAVRLIAACRHISNRIPMARSGRDQPGSPPYSPAP